MTRLFLIAAFFLIPPTVIGYVVIYTFVVDMVRINRRNKAAKREEP